MKEAWPTEHKIEQLREAGVVPRSLFSIACAGLFAGLLSLYFIGNLWGAVLEQWQQLLVSMPNGSLPEKGKLTPFFSAVISTLLVPALCVSVIVLVWGLFQTRFLFRPGLLSLRLDRINPFKPPHFQKVVGGVFLRLGVFIFSGGLGALCLWLMLGRAYGIFNLSRSDIQAWLPGMFTAALPYVLTLLGVVTFFSWLTGRLLFLFKHRMSREELEQEARDRE